MLDGEAEEEFAHAALVHARFGRGIESGVARCLPRCVPLAIQGRRSEAMTKSIMFLLAAFMLSATSDEVLVAQIFRPATNYTVGLRPWTIVSADFDRDGDFDLATALSVAFNSDGVGWVKILKNNGIGTFIPSDSLAVGDASSLEAADLDNDGDVDLIASDIYTKRVYILVNDGTGTFAVADSFLAGRGNYTNSFEPCAADLDGDGDNDLAVPIWPDSVSIFFNDGHGQFSGPTAYPTGYHPFKVISADIDHDGDSDLVVTNNGAASVSVMLNNGNGTFALRVNYSVGTYPQGVSLADYNRDGFLDMAVANSYPGTPFISVFMGKGDGAFNPRVDYPGCRPHAIASRDYDLDGDIDMAVPNNECNSVSVFLNNGDGTFTLQSTLSAGTGTNHVVAEDFDGDGDFDLAVENFDNDGSPGNTVSVFMNDAISTVAENESAIPTFYSIEQNYPNPFNPSTEIQFSLPRRSFVTLKMFDIVGREVATLVLQELDAGTHRTRWDAAAMPSGVYFYRLQAGAFTDAKKLIIVR